MSPMIKIQIGPRSYEVKLDPGKITVDDKPVFIQDVHHDARGALRFETADRQYKAVLDRGLRESFVNVNGREFELDIETDQHRLTKSLAKVVDKGGRKEIKASMPGLVIRVLHEVDQTIKKGDAVVILEAMKMENEIRAPWDGKIREIKAQQGQAVERGDLLVVME